VHCVRLYLGYISWASQITGTKRTTSRCYYIFALPSSDNFSVYENGKLNVGQIEFEICLLRKQKCISNPKANYGII